jgi:hypothetical protein
MVCCPKGFASITLFCKNFAIHARTTIGSDHDRPRRGCGYLSYSSTAITGESQFDSSGIIYLQGLQDNFVGPLASAGYTVDRQGVTLSDGKGRYCALASR